MAKITRLRNWANPAAFLLALSMIGLEVPVLGYLICFLAVGKSFFNNRYDFFIQVTFLVGVYGFYNYESAFPFKLYDLVVFVCPVIALYYSKQDKIVLKLTLITFAFLFIVFFFMYRSEESVGVQFRTSRQYLCIFYFIIPLCIFRNRYFSYPYFLYRLFVFFTVISLMYIFDGLVLHSNFFLPRVSAAASNLWNNFSVEFGLYLKRIYPSGVFIIGLLLSIRHFFAIGKFYILLFAVAILVTQTFSIILSIVLTLIVFSTARDRLRKAFMTFILFVALLLVERYTAVNLRATQFVQQLTSMVKGDVDYGSFATGRGAQVLPSIGALARQDKVWTGVGFLHPQLSSGRKFQTHSYYSNEEETKTIGIVEVTQVATIIQMGVFGFVLLHFYYWIIYRLLPKNGGRRSYLELLFFFSVAGVGGFAGLNSFQSIILFGAAVGCSILSHKSVNNTCVFS